MRDDPPSDPRHAGQSATGSNAGPQRQGKPAEETDAPRGTTSGHPPDRRKMETPGKPARGSMEDADS